jgi:hypothetical protein
MTPWHRFWFPHETEEDGDVPRDAELWSPRTLAETQQELWQRTAQATEAWWRFWSSSLPNVPLQPLRGTVAPAAESDTPAAAPETGKRSSSRRRSSTSAAKGAAHARHGARAR